MDSTDIGVLMEYCLYPLYVEGDKDIARRTFEILKDFSLSVDLVKLDKVTDYISIQNWFLTEYSNLPFVIETDELVRNIIILEAPLLTRHFETDNAVITASWVVDPTMVALIL